MDIACLVLEPSKEHVMEQVKGYAKEFERGAVLV
jgi:hypothetical protein